MHVLALCWILILFFDFAMQTRLGLNSMVDKGATSGSMAGLAAVNLGAGRTCKQVAAGYYHTCAVLDTSALKCWGNADYGQCKCPIDS